MGSLKAVIAMSGGVDSSVAAALLQEQGYECIGIHMKMYEESRGGGANKCCNLDGLEDARWVCEKLGIPFYVMNAEQSFKEKVVDYFLDAYGRGQTPNPCVECNRHIKFGELFKRVAELSADFLASGHYARITRDELTGEPCLTMARDRSKDQSYFLYTLSQERLRKILFPVGEMEKSQVYALAEKFGLVRQMKKPESQGLCFFAEANPQQFLLRYLTEDQRKPGEIVTENGRVLGMHRGLPFYTVGQRHGLGIGGIAGEPEGKAWYVKMIDRERNRIVAGREEDTDEKFLVCDNPWFISGKPPAGKREVQVRIRHRGVLIPASIEVRGERVLVESREPMRAPAAGQSAVFYDAEKVLGGAVIVSSSHPDVYEKETFAQTVCV